ncbi:MAG: toprim domain-containing protein, partial [Dehalococcoidales bacterium]
TAHQNGFSNVVASMGTSVTKKQVSSLKRLTRNIVLAMDADIAGREASKSAGETAIQPSEQDLEDRQDIDPNRPILSLNEGEVRKRRIFGPSYISQNVLDTEVSIFVLPSGKDPDDVIKEDSEKWRHLVEEAVPVLDYIFDMVISKLDLTTAKGKSIAIENLLPIVAQISNSVRYAHYRQKLARLVQISSHELEGALRVMVPFPEKRKIVDRKEKTVTRTVRSLVSNPREEYCLALLLQHPELKGSQVDLSPEYFGNSENREIFIAWQQANDLTSLKKNLDTAIHEHLDSLINRSLPPNYIEEKYIDCTHRLKEWYYKDMEGKKAEKLALEAESGGSGADLAKLEKERMEPALQLREIYTQKGKRGLETRR